MNKTIFINGMGTVGCNVARIALSSGFKVTGSKNSARIDDVKTKNLKNLQADFGDIDIYMASGGDIDKKRQEFNKAGFEVKGLVDDLDPTMVNAVVDASPDNGIDDLNFKTYYQKWGLSFILQGKGTYANVDPNVHKNGAGRFLSAPNSIACRMFDYFKDKNALQVSCNSTMLGTQCALLTQVFSPEEVKHIIISYNRRQYDYGLRGDGKLMRGPEAKIKQYHVDDIEAVVPQVKNKIYTKVAKHGEEYFHMTMTDVEFKKDLTDEQIRHIQEVFRAYPRFAYMEKGVKADDTINICDEHGVCTADCLLPLVTAGRLTPSTLSIIALNPQRSVIALSNVDWVHAATGSLESWKEAFDYTNKNAKWYGYSIAELKELLETKLN